MSPTPDPPEPDPPGDSPERHPAARGGKARPGRRNARMAVALALAAGKTQAAAARKGDVAARTVRLWQSQPEFAALVQRYRERMLDRALGRLQAGMGAAASTLREMAAGAAQDADRIRAACKVLELALKVGDHLALSERLRRVEELLAGDGPDGDAGTAGTAGAAGGGEGRPQG